MTSDDTLGVADIREILRLLPHRYPFLLIDRVIDIRGDQHGIGIKNLTINEPFLARSAENLVIPGVLVIEGMAQTACVLTLRSLPPTDRRRFGYFMTRSTKPSSANQRALAIHSSIMSTSSPIAATCGGTEARRRSAGFS